MTVADLQKYLRGLADVLGSAKADQAVKDLRDTADRLEPFEGLTVAALAEFLGLAHEYKTTGKISTPPPTKGRTPRTPAAKQAPPDPAAVIARVKELHDQALDPTVTRETVEAEIGAYSKLSRSALDAVAQGCGFKQRFGNRDAIVKALIGYVMGRKGDVERADV